MLGRAGAGFERSVTLRRGPFAFGWLLPPSGPVQVHRPEDVVPLEQLGGGALEAHLALLHEHGAVGEAQRGGDRLLHQDDGGAVGVDGPHDLEEVLHHRRGQTERQLVDHQQARPAEERLRQAEHLLLASGQVARGGVHPAPEGREPLEALRLPQLQVGALLAARPAGHPQVLGHGEGREHAAPAGHLGDAELRGAPRVQLRDVLAHEPHGAPTRWREAGDRPQHRGLPGAVGAEQGDHLALADLQVDAEQHLGLPVGHVDPLDRQQRRRAGHASTSSSSGDSSGAGAGSSGTHPTVGDEARHVEVAAGGDPPEQEVAHR